MARALDSIMDPESEADLFTLEIALRSQSRLADPVPTVPALFGVFERFPWSDGHEGFWGILTAIEKCPGYEPLLVASVRKSPGEFNLVMLNRLLNGGVEAVEGQSLLGLLQSVAGSRDYEERARMQAQALVDYRESLGRG